MNSIEHPADAAYRSPDSRVEIDQLRDQLASAQRQIEQLRKEVTSLRALIELPAQWEYHCVWRSDDHVDDEALESSLNKRGRDGWELVFVRQHRFFFRRRRTET